MKPTPFNAFVMGMVYLWGMFMCVQDFYGMDHYIEYVRNNWVDMHWSVGLTISCFGLIGFLVIHNQYMDAKRANDRRKW